MLDPCEEENDDIQDDEVCLGDDSVQRDEYSESDSEVMCYPLLLVSQQTTVDVELDLLYSTVLILTGSQKFVIHFRLVTCKVTSTPLHLEVIIQCLLALYLYMLVAFIFCVDSELC